MTGLIFDIAKDSYVDGPGVRTTFFLKGCHLRCQWCHNPEGQSFKPEMMFFKSKCSGCGNCTKACRHHDGCVLCGECTSVCPTGARRIAGRSIAPDEVLAIALKDKDYFDATGGGVTFSGGECMLQSDFVAETSALLRMHGISVAVDTAGDVPFGEFEKVMPNADYFLYDIKCMDENKHVEFTGVSNLRLLDNFIRIHEIMPEKLIVRVPVIREFNGTLEDIGEIADFLKPLHIIPELLPYHAMGEGKAEAIGKRAMRFSSPTPGEMAAFNSFFS